MLFFTADTHFGHERTRSLHKRPFKNVSEMDKVIVEKWNNTVKTDDTVYHLGDFGNPDAIQKLNGNIFFLPSMDYDKDVILALKSKFEIIEPNTVITCQNHTFQLVHEPMTASPSHHFYLFGHIHRFQMIKRNGLCVSTDAHYFTPISIDDVIFYKNAIEKHYDENVFLSELGNGWQKPF